MKNMMYRLHISSPAVDPMWVSCITPVELYVHLGSGWRVLTPSSASPPGRDNLPRVDSVQFLHGIEGLGPLRGPGGDLAVPGEVEAGGYQVTSLLVAFFIVDIASDDTT